MTRIAVDASALTQLVVLTGAPQRVSDGQGGYLEVPQPLSPPTDWAAIAPLTMRNPDEELPLGGTVLQSLTHVVQLRYRPDIDLDTQIRFVDFNRRSHRLYVRAVHNPQQQSEQLQVWCEEQAKEPD